VSATSPGSLEAVNELLVCHLGLVEYMAAVELQDRLRARVQSGELGDLLLLLEHPPVYTRGRRSDDSEIPMGEEWYRAQGVDVVRTDRGGKLTYHGPGQLVGYPIMRIVDVIAYLRTMEDAISAALAEEGVTGGPRDGLTGVWVEDRKIGSIGVHVSHGVTTHGFAVNVDNDLEPFEWVVPCGISGVKMTSLAREKGFARPASQAPPLGDVTARPASQAPPPGDVSPCFRKRMALAFATAHGRRQRLVTPERLGIEREALAPALAR
jgi:lipoyl(octanoyl) transferase